MSQKHVFAALVLAFLGGALAIAPQAHAAAAQPATADVQALLAAQDRMQQQLEALSARVGQLENLNAEIIARNRQLEAAAASNAPSPPAAAAAPAAAASPATSGAPAWLSRFKWNADFRLRHEHTEQGGLVDRDRDRIQSHFGFEAALTDDVAVGLQLATGGDDPRSGNQTLTGEFTRKSIGLDLAYLRWTAAEGVALTGGKMKYPVYRPASSKLLDTDVNPEGIALAIERPNVFANLYAFSVEERAAASDTTFVGAQVGTKLALGDAAALTAALGFSDLGAGVGRTPFFAQAANGNTLNPDGTLAFDFRVLQTSLEYTRSLRDLPLVAFADAARNSGAPDNLDTAYALGFLLGKAGAPGSWEFGYLYQRVEKDAWFGQLTDSDFGGGLTDAKGSVFRFGYAPVTNGVIVATYYLNDLAISNPASPRSTDEHQKLQLDFMMKF